MNNNVTVLSQRGLPLTQCHETYLNRVKEFLRVNSDFNLLTVVEEIAANVGMFPKCRKYKTFIQKGSHFGIITASSPIDNEEYEENYSLVEVKWLRLFELEILLQHGEFEKGVVINEKQSTTAAYSA